MRVISQDGRIDFPYENTVFVADMCAVWASFQGFEKYEVIGQYASTEKATEVIGMISEHYCTVKKSEFYGCEDAFFEYPVFKLPEYCKNEETN